MRRAQSTSKASSLSSTSIITVVHRSMWYCIQSSYKCRVCAWDVKNPGRRRDLDVYEVKTLLECFGQEPIGYV
jgi:hypothetical protein